ncbi:MAG: SDR family oxidoreductase [Bacteroidia bacterium]|nr:SDR family oxidoreductase [Bacteroidia bacterium]
MPKIALITGAATGLGYAIAAKLVQNGIRTLIVARDAARLEAACQTLGSGAEPVLFDLTALAAIPDMVADITRRYGRIDILVNNAGIHLKKPMLEVTDAEYQQVILTNQTAVFALSRECARVMATQQQGNIIHITSMAAEYGIPKVIAYTAAKSAVVGMTRAMAVELAPMGIRVNAVAPGFIRTAMSASALDNDPERKQKVLSRTPMGALGTPEDVARAVYFLASDESAYITGTILRVDGGNAIGF